MIIIGHDPGCSGALVALRYTNMHEPHIIGHTKIPTYKQGKRTHVDTDRLYAWMDPYNYDGPHRSIMFSERVGPMPHDTPTTAWSFGAANQAVLTLACALGYDTHEVTSQKWQRAILNGMPRADRKQIKSSAVAWASEAFPELASVLRLKKNSDIADAACIAELGRRLIKANKV